MAWHRQAWHRRGRHGTGSRWRVATAVHTCRRHEHRAQGQAHVIDLHARQPALRHLRQVC